MATLITEGGTDYARFAEQHHLAFIRLEQEVAELKWVVTTLLIAQSEKPKKNREGLLLDEALKNMGSFRENKEQASNWEG